MKKALVAVIVLGVLAGAGWFLYQQKNPKVQLASPKNTQFYITNVSVKTVGRISLEDDNLILRTTTLNPTTYVLVGEGAEELKAQVGKDISLIVSGVILQYYEKVGVGKEAIFAGIDLKAFSLFDFTQGKYKPFKEMTIDCNSIAAKRIALKEKVKAKLSAKDADLDVIAGNLSVQPIFMTETGKSAFALVLHDAMGNMVLLSERTYPSSAISQEKIEAFKEKGPLPVIVTGRLALRNPVYFLTQPEGSFSTFDYKKILNANEDLTEVEF